RDGLFKERLLSALPSCHECRSEMNCTEVCPKGISPTRAIKYIQRIALTHNGENLKPEAPAEQPEESLKIDRATFLRKVGVALLGTAAVITIGGVAAVTTVGSANAEASERWLPVARLSDVPPGQITTVLLK